MLHRYGKRAALGLTALLAWTRPGAAQIDYRNLDDDRPVRVEDAYAVERFAFELLAPLKFERERGGATLAAAVPELAWGLIANGQVGVKLPLAAVRAAGTRTWGLSGVRAFALYNFNTEGPWLPALSLRADGHLATGSLAGGESGLAVKVIATRSFGRNRLHVNGAWRFGADGAPPAVEGLDRWWYGAAVDRTLFRRSVLLVGSVHAARAAAGAPVGVTAAAGLRWQWTPTIVLDAGVARGLRRGVGHELDLTLGLSHAFALRGLMPRGAPATPPAPGGGGAHHH